MNKAEQRIVLNKISALTQQKLNQVSRAGTMINLGFGEFIKSKTAYKTENGEYKIKEILTTKYALHIDCGFRVTCGDKILLSKCDIFQPSSDQRSDFDEDNFEWDISGANRFDEFARMHFTENELDFYVQKITINKFGDLNIKMSNDFCIDIFVDASENDECWRFFKPGNTTDTHLVITGDGFYEN